MSGGAEAGQGARKPLVTVEYQTEIDVGTGKREKRMFVKMFFDAVDDGLLREMSPRLWRGLCCVARYVNEDGVVRVSQDRIARDLGISRQHANKLLGDLCRFRREETGERVLQQLEQGGVSEGGKRFKSNVYRLYPVAGFQFGRASEANFSVSPKGDSEVPVSVSPNGDSETPVPCHPPGDTVPCHPGGDTYKRVLQENTHTDGEGVCVDFSGRRNQRAEKLVSDFHRAFGRTGARKATERELSAAHELLDEHGEAACAHLIEFARANAEKTRYNPRYLQGIANYMPDALDDLERTKAKKTREAKRERVQRQREEAEERDWEARAPEDRVREMFEAKVTVARLQGKHLSEAEKEELFQSLLAKELGENDAALAKQSAG